MPAPMMAATPAAPHAHQLYLVYAYGSGVPAAQAILETQHLPRVARSLRRAGAWLQTGPTRFDTSKLARSTGLALYAPP